MTQQPDPPPRRPLPIAGIFTAEEWITCNVIREAHEQDPTNYPEALKCESQFDSALYGARVLTGLGHQFTGFDLDLHDLDEHGRPRIDIRTQRPLGGAANLIGLGPVVWVETALAFGRRHHPGAEGLLDLLDSLVQRTREQWGDAWEGLNEEAETALAQAEAEAGGVH